MKDLHSFDRVEELLDAEIERASPGARYALFILNHDRTLNLIAATTEQGSKALLREILQTMEQGDLIGYEEKDIKP